MTTERQIEANRLNAQRSTGPRTADGKARCRGNALIHGLAGQGIVVEEARREQFEDRKANWSREIRPATVEGTYALEKAVAATIQIDDCERAYEAIVVDQTTRARLAWDGDRRVEAAALAAKLPKRPDLIARQLESSRQGADWMLDAWDRLAEGLDESGGWTDFEASAALDLLGIPAGLRGGRTPIDAPSGGDPRSHRLALIAREVARLQALRRDALDPLDALDRRQAEASALVVLTKPGQLLIRYQRDAWRRFQSALKAARAPALDPKSSPDLVEEEPEDIEEWDDVFEPDLPANPLELRDVESARAARASALEARAVAAQSPDEMLAALIEMDLAIGHPLPLETRRLLETRIPASATPPPAPSLNRHQRRAAVAEARRA